MKILPYSKFWAKQSKKGTPVGTLLLHWITAVILIVGQSFFRLCINWFRRKMDADRFTRLLHRIMEVMVPTTQSRISTYLAQTGSSVSGLLLVLQSSYTDLQRSHGHALPRLPQIPSQIRRPLETRLCPLASPLHRHHHLRSIQHFCHRTHLVTTSRARGGPQLCHPRFSHRDDLPRLLLLGWVHEGYAVVRVAYALRAGYVGRWK